ncbi:hypothetical protein M422DRAFT_272304 [Sphaerobolus stellatus SS14]|uniref:Uncharacterized protein n=1 Tax=Sphaerobolus stellatus (strain SS14) TaxID=990650 RepID=A0A0C9UMT8_SPHS4|nr:hypothetical protein M422DRAFT_272304 [Sphaerobolus stellatus SS14]
MGLLGGVIEGHPRQVLLMEPAGLQTALIRLKHAKGGTQGVTGGPESHCAAPQTVKGAPLAHSTSRASIRRSSNSRRSSNRPQHLQSIPQEAQSATSIYRNSSSRGQFRKPSQKLLTRCAHPRVPSQASSILARLPEEVLIPLYLVVAASSQM